MRHLRDNQYLRGRTADSEHTYGMRTTTNGIRSVASMHFNGTFWLDVDMQGQLSRRQTAGLTRNHQSAATLVMERSGVHVIREVCEP